MKEFPWQLTTPLNAVAFDCDGTLSDIEGINLLAAENGVGTEVKALTAQAMGSTGLTPELYAKRLQLTQPTQQQVLWAGDRYCATAAQQAKDVITVFQQLGKRIAIISAGLRPAINRLADALQITHDHVFSVDIQFDQQGHYRDFDHTSPLANRDGKRVILQQLSHTYPHMGYIGDSVDDYAAHDCVSRFVGYGGMFYRENLARQCEFYIRKPSMISLLALLLTQQEANQLTGQQHEFYQASVAACLQGDVIFNKEFTCSR
jgi:phosphoserine phosphatase